MSSISSGLDSSNVADPKALNEFQKKYQIGDLIAEDVAEQVIDRFNKSLRKGDLVLVREATPPGYRYSVYEGDVEGLGLCYDAGDGILKNAEIHDIYKISDYRSFEAQEQAPAVGKAPKKGKSKVAWAETREVHIFKGKKHIAATLPSGASTYKHFLKYDALSQDTNKFFKIGIIKEVIRHNHVFTREMGMKALKIRVLHDGQLLREFDKAIDDLEAAGEEYRREGGGKRHGYTFERCQKAYASLQLYRGEVSRRGLEESANG